MATESDRGLGTGMIVGILIVLAIGLFIVYYVGGGSPSPQPGPEVQAPNIQEGGQDATDINIDVQEGVPNGSVELDAGGDSSMEQ